MPSPPDRPMGWADVQRKLAQAQRPEQAEAAESISPRRWAYREAAAVLVSFEPAALRPHGEPPGADAAEVLVHDSTVTRDVRLGPARWTLVPEVRAATLRRLGSRERLKAALAANPDALAVPDQRMLTACLEGALPPLDSLRAAELSRLLQAVKWLRDVLADLPPADEVRRKLERARFVEPFEQLVGLHFRGRERELQALREYTRLQPPDGPEAVAAQVRGWVGMAERPPLVVHGPGGVGKSTLMAKFFLDHVRAADVVPLPFVYLDFDDPRLSMDEPLGLYLEAVRQLRIQFPEAQELWTEVQHHLRDELVRLRAAAAAEPAGKTGSGTWLQISGPRRPTGPWGEPLAVEFAVAVQEATQARLGGAAGGLEVSVPLLLFLDTFEEVQYRSSPQMRRAAEFLTVLQRAYPTLRVVISSRSHAPLLKVHGHLPEELPLPDLDPEAAQGFLLAQGVTDPEVARQLADQVGRNPLSLKLAVEVAYAEGTDASGRLKDVPAGSRLSAARANVLQGRLYRRILGHIHKEEIRKLAHPGLVLRRVTAEIIWKVLAEPCGVTVPDLATADRLFHELRREVGLVAPAPDGSLRHRPDVRAAMLEMLKQDRARDVQRINERAAAYYAPQPGDLARVEELYHRLQLGEPPAVLDARWIEPAGTLLRGSIDELPPDGQVYLASRARLTLPEDVQRAASPLHWERYAVEHSTEALRRGDPERALELVRFRPERPGSSLLAVEGQALMALGRSAEAEALLVRGSEGDRLLEKADAGSTSAPAGKQSEAGGAPPAAPAPPASGDERNYQTQVLALRALAAEKRRALDEADDLFLRAQDAAPEQQVEGKLSFALDRLRLGRQRRLGRATMTERRRVLREAMSSIPEELELPVGTLRAVIRELGGSDRTALIRAMRQLGPRLITPEEVAQIAAAFEAHHDPALWAELLSFARTVEGAGGWTELVERSAHAGRLDDLLLRAMELAPEPLLEGLAAAIGGVEEEEDGP